MQVPGAPLTVHLFAFGDSDGAGRLPGSDGTGKPGLSKAGSFPFQMQVGFPISKESLCHQRKRCVSEKQ